MENKDISDWILFSIAAIFERFVEYTTILNFALSIANKKNVLSKTANYLNATYKHTSCSPTF